MGNGRTPTHIICQLTQGMSLEKMVQAMGRGTGIFPEESKANVKTLTNRLDLTLANAYASIMDNMIKTLTAFRHDGAHDKTVRDALESVLRENKEAFEETKRSVGKKKWNLRARLMMALYGQGEEHGG